MRKVKVWGGTHPDEIEPMELADALLHDLLPNVSAGIVNEHARRLGRRFVDINMSNAYPGDPSSRLYEECRAPVILRANAGFDTVIDLHTFNGRNVDAALIGSRGVSKASLGFLAHLGIRYLMHATPSSMVEHITDGFELELSREHYADRSFLRTAIGQLANGPDLGEARAADFSWLTHAGGVSVAQYDPDTMLESIQPLEPVSDAIAPIAGNGLPSALWFGVLSAPNEQGYWAELCVPSEPPDDTDWPK